METTLQRYREQAGLSRKAFALRVGVTEAYIGHLERGIRTLSAELAVEWERKAGVPRAVARPDLFGDLPKRRKAVA